MKKPQFFFPLFFTLAFQQSVPSTVQVDVLFPRDGGVYAPVYPFPIVFAIHNISTVWNYDFQFTYAINSLEGKLGSTGNDSSQSPSSSDFVPVLWPMEEENYLPTGPHTKAEPPPDVWLFINATDEFIDVQSGDFELYVRFIVDTNCTDGPPVSLEEKDQLLRRSPVWIWGVAHFSIAPNGTLPDVVAAAKGADGCAEPLAAMGVNGSIPWNDAPVKNEGLAGHLHGTQCPILTEPEPKEIKCAYPVNSTDQGNIAEYMLEFAGCSGQKGVSWPSKDLVGPCESPSSKRVPLSMTAAIPVGLMLTIFFL